MADYNKFFLNIHQTLLQISCELDTLRNITSDFCNQLEKEYEHAKRTAEYNVAFHNSDTEEDLSI